MPIREVQLKRVLADTFGITPEEIEDSTSVDTVESWDSLRHLNLVLALEAEFNVRLTEEQSVEVLSYPLIKAVLEEHGVIWSAETTEEVG